jgi:hypothetical protein
VKLHIARLVDADDLKPLSDALYHTHCFVPVPPPADRVVCPTQRMAEERLTLQELESPGGRALGAKISVEANLGRWKLLWNGHDVVHKVLHW